MSFTWRMEVKDETFTNLRDHPSVGQDYITPDAGVASLDDFSVDGAGNCLEARFRASPKFVDIRARDVVSLEVSEDDGVSWTPVYRGYVVTAGNPRSDAIQEYKLVGLRQRFFEITNPQILFFENDAAKQAENVLLTMVNNNDLPAGVTAPTFVIGQDLFPQTGFVNGLRHPQKESYGDGLKAIAESVGRFVVPVGETYTYDGKTYNELETVPAVRFGVDGAGNIIFRRPQADDAVFSETGDNVLSEYKQISGEELADTVELVYADSFVNTDMDTQDLGKLFGNGNFFTVPLSNAIPIPLSRSFSFGNRNATRQVRLDSPFGLMTNNPFVDKIVGEVVNADGCITGGVTEIGPSSSAGRVDFRHAASTTDGFIVQIQIRATQIQENFTYFQVRAGRQVGVGGGISSASHDYSAGPDNLSTTFKDYTFSFLPASNLAEDGTTTLTPIDLMFEINGRFIECKNLKMLVPDVDVGGTKSEQFASGFVRDVQQDVAEVTLVNQFGPVAPRMVWTPEGESPVTVPVERIQYTLTTNDGLITQYELGQAFDAELLSERAVLKGLAREAVSE